MLFLLRPGDAGGPEAEADPHVAAHAPRCQPGLQHQAAPPAACHLLPLHQDGDRHSTHLHSAGCLLPHRHPQPGEATHTSLSRDGQKILSATSYTTLTIYSRPL